MQRTARDIRSLIVDARNRGVVLHPDPHGGSVIIHSHRDVIVQRAYVEPLRARREEVAAALIGGRAAPDIPESEARYRREVRREPDTRREPDVPIGELPWHIFAGMVISLCSEVVDARFAEAEWERSIDGRDDEPPPQPPSPRPSARSGWVEL